MINNVWETYILRPFSAIFVECLPEAGWERLKHISLPLIVYHYLIIVQLWVQVWW